MHHKALRARLPNAPGATEWAPGDAVEVTIECGDALVETRFGAWRDRIALAMSGGADGRA